MKQRKKNNQTIQRIPFILIFLFVLIWITGISFGEPGTVLEQATRVCLSCIGIG